MEKIRVLVDGYFLGVYSGYGRYVEELCNVLDHMGGDFEFYIIFPRNRHRPFSRAYENLTFVPAPSLPFPAWEQFILPLYRLKLKCRYAHYPYNTAALASLGTKFITTVHDLTFLRQDVERNWKAAIIHKYMGIAFAFGTKRSAKLIAVSRTTQRQLETVALPSTVVYNTVASFVSEHRPHVTKSDSTPYFIHRGSLAPEHRNTMRIIQAFLSSETLRQGYRLKILGVPNARDKLDLRPEDPVDLLPPVSDRDLANLYHNSVGVLAVSIVEGFCLPILEAFGFDAPVVTSNLDPMHEIASDAALIVDPYDVADIQRAMLEIAGNTGTAEDLRRKGRRRYQDFSISATAEALRRVYASV